MSEYANDWTAFCLACGSRRTSKKEAGLDVLDIACPNPKCGKTIRELGYARWLQDEVDDVYKDLF
jgi:hypothetical protein